MKFLEAFITQLGLSRYVKAACMLVGETVGGWSKDLYGIPSFHNPINLKELVEKMDNYDMLQAVNFQSIPIIHLSIFIFQYGCLISDDVPSFLFFYFFFNYLLNLRPGKVSNQVDFNSLLC